MQSLESQPTSAEREHALDLPGGRRLSYVELGATSGPAVVVLDGPGSRGLARAAADAATERGLRLVAPDRPGFFGSTPVADRTITDWVADHAALLDALGVRQAAIFAQSGGTPYALAVAAALPDRVPALAFAGGLAPLDDPGALAEAKQLRGAVRLARRAPWLLRLLLRIAGRRARRDPQAAAITNMPDAPADREVLEDERFRALHVQATGEILSRPAALAQELILVSQPWGVDFERVEAPAAFWTGERDETHPPAHARRLAALIGGEVTVVPNAATFGLLPYYGTALDFLSGASASTRPS